MADPNIAERFERGIVETHGSEGARYLLAQAGIQIADSFSVSDKSALDLLAARRMQADAKRAGKKVPTLLEAVRELEQARSDRMIPVK